MRIKNQKEKKFQLKNLRSIQGWQTATRAL